MALTMESGDPEGALYQLKAMAKQGSSDAMAEIGIIYETGPPPIEKDVVCALRWFDQAASLGNIEGLLGVARLHLLGHDVPRDDEKARAIYEFIVQQSEDRRALFALGWIYHCGFGVKADLARAHDFYRRATKVGHLVAPKWRSSVYRQQGSYLKSAVLWVVSVVRIWWVAMTDRSSMRLHRQL